MSAKLGGCGGAVVTKCEKNERLANCFHLFPDVQQVMLGWYRQATGRCK